MKTSKSKIRQLIRESIKTYFEKDLILEKGRKGGKRRRESGDEFNRVEEQPPEENIDAYSEDNGNEEPTERHQNQQENNSVESEVLNHYKAAIECIKDLREWKFGTTKVVNKPFYAFMVANKGDKKIEGGTVKPSQGMGRHKNTENTRLGIAEELLEYVRANDFSDAVPRKGSVFLTPYSDGGLWKHFGDTVFLVMIPAGSKVTYVDGQMASETSVALVPGSGYDSTAFITKNPTVEEMKKEIPGAKNVAKKYWSGIHWPTRARAEEVITKAKATIIGPIDEMPPFPDEFSNLIDDSYLTDYFFE